MTIENQSDRDRDIAIAEKLGAQWWTYYSPDGLAYYMNIWMLGEESRMEGWRIGKTGDSVASRIGIPEFSTDIVAAMSLGPLLRQKGLAIAYAKKIAQFARGDRETIGEVEYEIAHASARTRAIAALMTLTGADR